MRDATISIEGMVDFSTILYYESVLARTRSTHDHIAEALGARQRQDQLSLYRTPGSRITENFLTSLCMHTRLTELAVHHFEDLDDTKLMHFEMVAQLLRVGTSIQHLLLHGYGCRGNKLNCVLDALKHGNSRVSKLSLVHCHFFHEAKYDLIQFFQSVSPRSNALRELHVEGTRFMFGLHTTIGMALGKMLTRSELNAISLVGPATTLDLAGLCNIMKEESKLMRFSQLTLHGCEGGISPLSQCLPNLTNVRTLTWYGSLEPLSAFDLFGVNRQDHGSRKFMQAIRRNGSLTNVVVEPKGFIDYFATLDYDKILIYCQRNEQLPIVLKSTPFLPLVPILFSVAKQAERTAPNTLLLGLLTMATDLHGTTLGKRKRSRCMIPS